jgi:hypothetical protein
MKCICHAAKKNFLKMMTLQSWMMRTSVKYHDALPKNSDKKPNIMMRMMMMMMTIMMMMMMMIMMMIMIP